LLKNSRLSHGVPEQCDPKAKIALALYREAIGVRSTPYEFLGYFKIINTRYPSPAEQVSWIKRTIPLLSDEDAKKRASDLSKAQADIGDYLYVSGRCAVAHAYSDPVVDPDNAEGVLRLSADMPLARALAEYLIEHEYGIRWESSK
jgi:hypothetical protein